MVMISSIDNFSDSFNYLGLQDKSQEISRLKPQGEEDPSLNKVKKTEQSKQDLSFSDKTQKNELSEEDLKKIEELKKRDAEVRTHEQAHLAAAGSLSNGAASFEYEMGPDNKRYAVGGEVSIDTSKIEGDPQATIAKAKQIRRAALSPAEPSGQDRQVAAQAVKMEIDANKELSEGKNSDSDNLNLASAFKSNEPAGNKSDPKTDFYKNIQSSTSANNSGVSMLDYYI